MARFELKRVAHAMIPTVALVGAGPTAIYTLRALVGEAARPFALTIFEAQATAGRGTPYRPGWNDPAMLSNIASIEIPPLEESLVEWLGKLSPAKLAALGVDADLIDERVFYPRLVLGDYFYDQFQAMLKRATTLGIEVSVRTRCKVLDAVSEAEGMLLTVKSREGVSQERFDHVVLATGHQWPASPEVRPGYYLSPWPASALAKVPPCKVGIRGTSLSAIDASVALSVSHGAFIETSDTTVEYVSKPGTDTFHMTMISRKGLLPEADFFAPLPYEPLSICTPEAMERLLETADGELLDSAFDLFKQELADADPEYAERTGLAALSLEEFCDSYFADRMSAEPFAWAAANLLEAQQNYEAKYTVPWRYAILRMHEVIAVLVPYLEQDDFKRFSRSFKPVFVDDYATVPHLSIQRLLALHRAGKLDILAVGDDYRIDTHRPEGGAVLHLDGEQTAFSTFIEATGQRALAAKDFPFPSLRSQGVIQDAATPDAPSGSRGIAIDDQFHPVSDAVPADQLFCLSLPFILGRHPFHQGITSSHEMGRVVGEQLAAALGRWREAASLQETEII